MNLSPRDFAIHDDKLRTYQNMTGIDDITFNEIWKAGIKNRRILILYTEFKHNFKSIAQSLVP